MEIYNKERINEQEESILVGCCYCDSRGFGEQQEGQEGRRESNR